MDRLLGADTVQPIVIQAEMVVLVVVARREMERLEAMVPLVKEIMAALLMLVAEVILAAAAVVQALWVEMRQAALAVVTAVLGYNLLFLAQQHTMLAVVAADLAQAAQGVLEVVVLVVDRLPNRVRQILVVAAAVLLAEVERAALASLLFVIPTLPQRLHQLQALRLLQSRGAIAFISGPEAVQ
jgi:hypothetical protein